MAANQAQQGQLQSLKTQAKVPGSNPTKGKDFARAAVIGFARVDCRRCFGRGRIGFDVKFNDDLHVIICPCVEMMDLETVQKSWERDHVNKEKPTETASQENATAQTPAPEHIEGTGEAVGTAADGAREE